MRDASNVTLDIFAMTSHVNQPNDPSPSRNIKNILVETNPAVPKTLTGLRISNKAKVLELSSLRLPCLKRESSMQLP